MAKFTFNMPDIGEGIAEAEIVQWHKQVGDQISEDEEFVDMMTDKATVPMESPVNGKILEIAGGEGDMVSIGSMLVVIEVEGEVPEDVVEEATPAPASAPAPKDEAVEERIEVENSDGSDADDALAADLLDALDVREHLDGGLTFERRLDHLALALHDKRETLCLNRHPCLLDLVVSVPVHEG